ncbi:MAG: hypothetical protein HETSPECPRED_005621 [Heterodermia speciosa]|uniref:Secreted protein n=1 Tax=Heterodermia speciosa TaxID=116794 RepID=A0A8H3FJ21_9LECA|nr:MAG: hypothetical protein HETSPECPRED_005621 [Heterodermia speciosa]
MLCLRDFVRLITLVSVILVSFCAGAPAPRNNSPEGRTLPARQDSSNLSLRRASQTTSQLSSHPARSLQSRVWKLDYLDEGWALYFSTYEQFVKIENAATTLQTFFDSVAEYAASQWINQPPLKELSIQFGELILDFKCDVTEIPWNFVQMFAERMKRSVLSGFAAAFEAVLEHVLSGGTVWVRLRTIP